MVGTVSDYYCTAVHSSHWRGFDFRSLQHVASFFGLHFPASRARPGASISTDAPVATRLKDFSLIEADEDAPAAPTRRSRWIIAQVCAHGDGWSAPWKIRQATRSRAWHVMRAMRQHSDDVG